MAGGGIKINNIKVSGGADGKTPIFKIEGENLYNSYDNGSTWNIIGKVVGANGQDGRDGVDGKDGVDGEKGATGAKLVSQVFYGKTSDGDNVYKQTFDDGTTTFWTAPKGDKGDKGDKGESFEEFTETVNDLKEENELLKEKTANNTAKIENLTNILFENEQVSVVEVSQAFVSRQTADGENIIDVQNVFPKLIKGSTIKSKNLIPYPYFTTTVTTKGVTFTDNGDGSITINGTATETAYFYIVNNSQDYVFTNIPAGGTVSFGKSNAENVRFGISIVPSGESVQYKSTTSFMSYTATKETQLKHIYVVVDANVTCSNVVVRPMLNFGDITPYSPYFSDLKRAYFDSIKSIGRNLFNGSGFDGLALNEDGSFTTTKYYADSTNAVWKGEPNTTYTIATFDYNFSPLPKGDGTIGPGGVTFYANGTWLNNNYLFPTFTTDEKGEVVLKAGAGSYNNIGGNKAVYIAIYKGDYRQNTKDTKYEPYVEDTYKVFDNLYLDEYDSFNLQTGELTRQTGHLSRSLSFTEEELAGYDSPIVSVSGTIVAYKLATPTVTKVDGVPKFYKVYNQGQEVVVQGEVDNSEYGAMCTITNDYLVKIGGENE